MFKIQVIHYQTEQKNRFDLQAEKLPALFLIRRSQFLFQSNSQYAH